MNAGSHQMDTNTPVDAVYRLLAQRDLAANLKACELARNALPESDGPALLALHQALTHAISDLLMDLGESGPRNLALWDVDPATIDVQAMSDECATSWAEVKRLRNSGVDSRALIDHYEINEYAPIGSREWMSRMGLGVPHRHDPEWIADTIEKLNEKLG